MLSALDLLRRLGWSIIDFIYGLIDTLFKILQQLNLFDIVDSISNNTVFSNFHSGVLAIAITLLALFIIWKFVMKILDPDDGLSVGQIIKDSVKYTGLSIRLIDYPYIANSIFNIDLSDLDLRRVLRSYDTLVGEKVKA